MHYTRSLFFPSLGLTVQSSKLSKVRVLPDGKILFAGMAQQSLGGSIIRSFIARYNADGSPDATYGSMGFSWLPNLKQPPADMYLYPDASVLTVGNASDPSHWYMSVFKIDSTGSPVSSFGTAGVDTFTTDIKGYATALTVRPDGKIILLGNLLNDTVGNYAGVVTLLESNGALSPEIPGGQAVIKVPGHEATSVNAILMDGYDKMFIAGSLYDVSHMGYDTFTAFVGRLNSNGSADTSYYGTGYEMFIHPPDSGYLWSISSFSCANLLPAGKILVAGSIGQVTPINALIPSMFMVRFRGAGTTDVSDPMPPRPLIFPNPATTELTISCINNSYTSYRVVNNAGQQVLQGKLLNGRTILNIKSLAQGTYFISIKGDNGTTVSQFVKL